MNGEGAMAPTTSSGLAYIACAILVSTYAWDRFNTPTSNRSSTRQTLYWKSCIGYVASALGLFAVLSVLLEQPFWREFLHLKDDLPAPLLATLAMTTLLPLTPMLNRLDRGLLTFFLDLGAIPAEAKRRAASLTPHDFSVTTADVEALREAYDDAYGETFGSHLRCRGIAGLGRAQLRFTRVVKLYAGIQQLAAERRYSRFFDQNSDEFAVLGRQLESFIRRAVTRLDLAARLHALTANAVEEELMEDKHHQTFAEDCREHFILMARFLAQAVLRSEASEKEIIARLRRIGFAEAEPMNAPLFPINSLTALGLGLFAYLELTGYLFSHLAIQAMPSAGVFAPMPSFAFTMAVKITLVRVATLALTVWLIQRYPFFRRAPGEGPRYFAYLVAGLAAAALTTGVGLCFHVLDPDPVAGLQREVPVVLLSLMLCAALAFCCDDWTKEDHPPIWLRPVEAVGCGAVMALGMIIVHVADLGALNVGGGWLLAAFIVLPGALGMMVGACVPHIYREANRVVAASRAEALRAAAVMPSDPQLVPVVLPLARAETSEARVGPRRRNRRRNGGPAQAA
jgi:hypothetical protein